MAIGDYVKTDYVDGTVPGITEAALDNNENKTKEIDTFLNGNIDTANLKDDSITNAKMADDSVQSDSVLNGTITYNKLNNDVKSQFRVLSGGS